MTILPTFSGISLWLVPDATQIDTIKSALPRRPLTDDTLSPSSYPVFPPHITLATVPLSDPGIEDVLLDAIPKNQKPVGAKFQSLVVGDHYFRSVFIDIQRTEELVDLQAQIATSLGSRGLEPSATRFPHMSLCYIADRDKNERDRMARVLRDTGVVGQAVDPQSVSLRCGDVDLIGFNGAEIWVVKCEGHVETWEVERKVTLTA